MDSFDNVKVEKENAMRRYHTLRKFSNLVRLLEVCVALILLSWSSTRLPIAARIVGEFLRRLSVLLLSTPSVFLIGNVIIVALVAQSGKLPGKNSEAGNNSENDLYDEYVRNSEASQRTASVTADTDTEPAVVETVEEEKQIVCSENAVALKSEETVTKITEKLYRRTQSESFEREISVKPRNELRRSVTEKTRKTKVSSEEPARLSDAVDDLSNEEFRLTVEAFIKKQQMFLREEHMAVIVSNKN